jgi:hypothetical protein
MKVDPHKHNHSAFTSNVKDIAPPLNAPRSKPSPPANMVGPLKPGTDPAPNMQPRRRGGKQ